MRALSDQASMDPYVSPYALGPSGGMDLNGMSPRHLAKKLRPDSGDSFGTPTSGQTAAQLPAFPVISAAPLHGALCCCLSDPCVVCSTQLASSARPCNLLRPHLHEWVTCQPCQRPHQGVLCRHQRRGPRQGACIPARRPAQQRAGSSHPQQPAVSQPCAAPTEIPVHAASGVFGCLLLGTLKSSACPSVHSADGVRGRIPAGAWSAMPNAVCLRWRAWLCVRASGMKMALCRASGRGGTRCCMRCTWWRCGT